MAFFSFPGLCLVPNVCKQLEEQFNFMTQETTSFEGEVFFNNVVSIKCARIANVKIDSYSFIGPVGTVFNADIGSYTSIADNVIIGTPKVDYSGLTSSSALFASSPFAEYTGIQDRFPKDYDENMFNGFNPVSIGHDVWIGCHACISGGVHIGTGAVIGTGSVVTKDVEPYAVVVGRDRQVKKRFSDEICADLEASAWWRYDMPKMLVKNKNIPYQQPKELLAFLKNAQKSELIELPQKWQKFRPIDYDYFEIIEVNAD